MKRVWLEAGGRAPTSSSPTARIRKSGQRHRRGSSTTRWGQCASPAPACCWRRASPTSSGAAETEAQHWQPGNPLDPNTTMGMLIDNTHADSVHSFIRGGESKKYAVPRRAENPWPAAGPTISLLTSTRPPPSAGKIFRPGAGGDAIQSEDERCGLPTTATTASARRGMDPRSPRPPHEPPPEGRFGLRQQL